ncbi:hypothetical protein ACLB1O_10175 [Escherichia coli]
MRYQRHCFSFSQAAFAADSDIADGQTQRFDFSILQSMAHDLAQTAWRGAPRPLPDTLATMTPQAYNSIQYDAKNRSGITLRTVNWTLSSSIWECILSPRSYVFCRSSNTSGA